MTQNSQLPLNRGMLERPRVHTLIRQGLQRPLLVLLAGPGFGKTQAMASFLAASYTRYFWLRLSSLDNFGPHFWSHLIRALAHQFASLSEKLEPMDFPDNLSKFDVFIGLLQQETGGPGHVVWVFDDFGEINDPAVRAFFGMLAGMSLDSFRLVLISNRLAGSESVAYIASDRSLILGDSLRFTRSEVAALYEMHDIAVSPADLEKLYQYTEGWPMPLHLLAMQQGHGTDLRPQAGKLTDQTVSMLFEQRFFGDYPPPFQKLLIQLSLLPSFDSQLAIDLYRGDPSDLKELGTQVFLSNEPLTGRFALHNLYRLFLQSKRYLLSSEEELSAWRRGAEFFWAAGETMEAIVCCRNCGDYAGMLQVISHFSRVYNGIPVETAAFFLEHLDLFSEELLRRYPLAEYLRALIYIDTLQLDKAESILLDLQAKLPGSGAEGAQTLLGEVLASLGTVHMMRTQEDFGDYFKEAMNYLPNGTSFRSKNKLVNKNNHNFSMADNQPGARERMERAVHYGVPWMTKVLGGGMGGMEHIFSAEAAYLSWQLGDAQEHAYRAIYCAEGYAQHDLVCNGYCILARLGLLHGDLAEVEKQIDNITRYAAQHDSGALRDICDTVFGWYYIKMHDYAKIPKNILSLDYSDRSLLTYGRPQIVYANYLINTGEYARLIGMLEHPQGLYLTRGIWPDRICLFIMLAIGYYQLGKATAAVEALWTAYDMCHQNGLTTLFIEAEGHMERLIQLARRQQAYPFDASWLDDISRQAQSFARRATGVRTAYKRKNTVSGAEGSPLTARELEILGALARGLTREEIAAELFISVNTVKSFIRSIYNKLDAANRAEAVSIAISRGYLDIPAAR